MKASSIWKLITLALCGFLAACGGSGGGGASVTLALSSSTVVAGNSLTATATINPIKAGPKNGLSAVFSSNRTDLVHFATATATNFGSSTISQTTDANGQAQVVLNIDNTVAIPAGGVDVTVSVTIEGISTVQILHINSPTASTVVPTNTKLTLSVTPTSVAATKEAIATATVTDSAGVPLSGQTVTFSVSNTGLATVTSVNSGITGSDGKAYATVTAGGSNATVFLNASVGTAPATATATVPFTITAPGSAPAAATPSTITLALDKTSVAVGQQAVATATVQDSLGAPIAGAVVTFSSDATVLELVGGASFTTDTDGKAYALVRAVSTTLSYGVLNAAVPAGTGSISKNLIINISTSAVVGKPQMTLTLGAATADPATVREVTAVAELKDSTGAAVSGAAIDFSILSGPADIQAGLTTITTGIDGKATSIVVPRKAPFDSNVLVRITTTYQGITYSLVATFVVQSNLKIALTFDKANVNTGQQVIATATLTTSSGQVVPTQAVAFDIVSGPAIVTGFNAATGSDGRAQAILTPNNTTVISNVLCRVTTTYGGTTYTGLGSFQVNASNVALALTVNDVSGSSQVDTTAATIDATTTQVNVKAKFSYLDNVPIPGKTVTFTVLNPGLFWGSTGAAAANGTTITATTSTSGEAMVVAVPDLTAITPPSFIYVQASVTVADGSGTNQTYTQVVPIKVAPLSASAATNPTIDFQLDKTAVINNPNNNQVMGTATVKTGSGSPDPGRTVTFSIVSGAATVSSDGTTFGATATATTDSTGIAMVTIVPSASLSGQSSVIVQASFTVGAATFTRIAQVTVNPLVNLALTTNIARVDANNGEVVATASVTDSSGTPIVNQPVTFTILAGPATVPGAAVNTGVDGKANAIVTPGNTNLTSNVLIQASTTIATRTYSQVTSFQIVRGTGVLTLSVPSSASMSIDSTMAGGNFLQQIPFTLTDSNGNPRTGVDVTLTISDQLGVATITPASQTVTTDAAGRGIFNLRVAINAPAPGTNTIVSVVYKGQAAGLNPVIAYGGCQYNLVVQAPPALAATPTAITFDAAAPAGTTSSVVISGGIAPYIVQSSNPGNFTATLGVDGVTATATVANAASNWTETLIITDSTGKTLAVTVKR